MCCHHQRTSLLTCPTTNTIFHKRLPVLTAALTLLYGTSTQSRSSNLPYHLNSASMQLHPGRQGGIPSSGTHAVKLATKPASLQSKLDHEALSTPPVLILYMQLSLQSIQSNNPWRRMSYASASWNPTESGANVIGESPPLANCYFFSFFSSLFVNLLHVIHLTK